MYRKQSSKDGGEGGGSFLTAGPLYQQRGAEIKRFFNNVEAFWNRQIKSLQKTET